MNAEALVEKPSVQGIQRHKIKHSRERKRPPLENTVVANTGQKHPLV
jgi:hypothetical protein